MAAVAERGAVPQVARDGRKRGGAVPPLSLSPSSMSTREQARRRRPSRTTTSARRAAVDSRVAQVAHAKSCLGGVEPRERRRDRAADRATAQVELMRTGARARATAARNAVSKISTRTKQEKYRFSTASRRGVCL